MKKVQIIYSNNKPYGIRDFTGYLLFFRAIRKYDGQEERYAQEVLDQCKLAELLAKALNGEDV